ncbi:unnamed protein product [Effrenium voratum]|nr:unnamed protein product [Effrenium voratum]
MRGAAFRHLALPAIFVFCNACCLALVAAAAHVSWRLGFSVCVMYFLSLTGLGANLEKQQMLLGLRSGVWCLDCFLLGALGSWLSMSGIGPWEAFPLQDTTELPKGIGHATHGTQLYFSSNGRLTRTDAASATATEELEVLDPHSFLEYNGDLFFFGRLGDAEGLWAVKGHGSSPALLQRFAPGLALRPAAANSSSAAGGFGFVARGRCGHGLAGTVEFSSNGTAGVPEAEVSVLDLCLQLGAGWTLRPPTGRLLGVLLLGVLPQTVLGAYLLIQKQVPGAFFNVFAGIYAMVFLIWLLMKADVGNMLFFLKASAVTYAATTCVAVALHQQLWSDLSAPFAEELGTWSVTVAAGAFFASSLLLLDMPNAPGGSCAVFAVLQLLLILWAPFTQRSAPALLAALGLLLLLHQLTADVFLPKLRLQEELNHALQLAMFYALGTFVLLGFLLYKDQRHCLEAAVKVRWKAPAAPPPDAADSAAAEKVWEPKGEEPLPLLEPEDDTQESWLMLEQLPMGQLLQLQRHFGAVWGESHGAKADEEHC